MNNTVATIRKFNKIKTFKTFESYTKEKNAILYLQDFQLTFIEKLLSFNDVEHTITFQNESNQGTLEDVMKCHVLSFDDRCHYWRMIQAILKSLHSYDCVHGDFKSKNFLVKDKVNIVLCNFDSCTIQCTPTPKEKFLDDMKNALLIYYQLFLVREDDSHHWPYNNYDPNFRYGEQIYDFGFEFQKDLNTFMTYNILDQNIPSFQFTV